MIKDDAVHTMRGVKKMLRIETGHAFDLIPR